MRTIAQVTLPAAGFLADSPDCFPAGFPVPLASMRDAQQVLLMRADRLLVPILSRRSRAGAAKPLVDAQSDIFLLSLQSCYRFNREGLQCDSWLGSVFWRLS
jgi:hypothetical protein